MKKTSKNKPNKQSIVIALLIITTMILLIVVANLLSSKNETQAPVANQSTAQTQQSYKFAYLKAKCQLGLDNYEKLQPQITAEIERIKTGLNSADSVGDTATFNEYKRQSTELGKSVDLITQRHAKLQSCIESVNNQLDFTASEIADINSFVSTSTTIPSAN